MLSQEQMNIFYNQFGDEVKDDGEIIQNELRIESIRKRKEKENKNE